MEQKTKLIYKGRTIPVSFKSVRDDDKNCWIFTGINKRIVVKSSGLPIALPAAQLPVEIRAASNATRRHARKYIWNAIYAIAFPSLKNTPTFYPHKIKQYSERLDTDTRSALKSIVDSLPRFKGELGKEAAIKLDELLSGYAYEAVLQDGRIALVNVTETAVSNDVSKDTESVIKEMRKVINDVAPQVAADKRKAQLAWIREVRGCSKIETDAALLRTDGMTLPEIAKRLPHKKGKAMTRQGVQRVLRRFEKKAGQRGLFSTGTYREQEQAKLDEKRIVGSVYWENAEERNKPDEDSEDATDS